MTDDFRPGGPITFAGRRYWRRCAGGTLERQGGRKENGAEDGFAAHARVTRKAAGPCFVPGKQQFPVTNPVTLPLLPGVSEPPLCRRVRRRRRQAMIGAPSYRRIQQENMMHSIPSALVGVLIAVPAFAQDKHTLRLKFVPGHVVHTLQSQDMVMNMAMGEQKMNTTMAMQMWCEAKTIEVKDGVAVMEQTYRRMKAKADGPGMKVDYDSDVEGSKAGMLAGASKLVGQKVTVKVDEGSNLKDVAVPEDLVDGLERAGLNLRESFEQSFTSFPKDPIAIGETWTTTREMAMGQMGKMKTKVTNKLVEVKDNVATIEQKMELDEAGSELMPGMKVTLTKAEGLAKVDLRNGIPVDMKTEMQMKMGDAMAMTIQTLAKQVEPPAPKAASKAEPPAPGK